MNTQILKGYKKIPLMNEQIEKTAKLDYDKGPEKLIAQKLKRHQFQ